MIRADKGFAGVAVGLADEFDALVRASIVQDPDRTIGVPHHDNRLGPDGSGIEVAVLGYQTIMPDIDPAIVKKVLHLRVEDLSIDVHITVHLIISNEILIPALIIWHHNFLSSRNRLLRRCRDNESKNLLRAPENWIIHHLSVDLDRCYSATFGLFEERDNFLCPFDFFLRGHEDGVGWTDLQWMDASLAGKAELLCRRSGGAKALLVVNVHKCRIQGSGNTRRARCRSDGKAAAVEST